MPDEYGLQILGLLSHAGLSPQDLTGVCLASVVPPLTGKFTEACRVYLGYDPLVVDAGVKTGVRIRYEDPRAVGADRVADAAAVQKLYGTPACVVDFGTATTFDAISANGDYLGGAIARVSGLRPKRCSCGRPSCRGWTCSDLRLRLGGIRSIRCSPGCYSAMSVWWKAW
jgi:type III pantothenate kinase